MLLKNLEPLPAINSAQSQSLSIYSNSQPESKVREKPEKSIHQNISSNNNNNNTFQKPKPIGIYNFNSNKSSISSLEQNIDETVSAFIEQNKENIIKCVAQEVQKKFEEKIKPMTDEISNIKKEFNSLYEEEWNDFKQSNILNDCHNNIMELNNKVGIMNENIKIYNDNIKGFNIADNRLQFLNKLNKDLDEFISGIGSNGNNEDYKHYMDIDNNMHKIEKEMNRQDNLNHELDNVFNETMEMLKEISKEEVIQENRNNNNDNDIRNCSDILNNFRNTVNTFETKFDYEKPIMNNTNNNMKVNKESNKNEITNLFDDIPNFFEFIS
jgi:hypothetical protein